MSVKDDIITNDKGGKQSQIEGQPTELPPLALIEVSKVMQLGASRYPRESDLSPNWYKIGCFSNLDHCLEHAFNFLAERNNPPQDKDKMLEELSHCAARALMSLEQLLRNEL